MAPQPTRSTSPRKRPPPSALCGERRLSAAQLAARPLATTPTPTRTSRRSPRGATASSPPPSWRHAPPHLGHTARCRVDWASARPVSPVKDQGTCGSCWSFAATGAMIEASLFVDRGVSTSLSEEQLIDCDKGAPQDGCKGGAIEEAFRWVRRRAIRRNSVQFSERPYNPPAQVHANGGILSESEYPYAAGTSGAAGKCHLRPVGAAAVTITGYVDLPASAAGQLIDEEELGAMVAERPVAVAVEGDQQCSRCTRAGCWMCRMTSAVPRSTTLCWSSATTPIAASSTGRSRTAGHVVGRSRCVLLLSPPPRRHHSLHPLTPPPPPPPGYFRLIRNKNACGVATLATSPPPPPGDAVLAIRRLLLLPRRQRQHHHRGGRITGTSNAAPGVVEPCFWCASSESCEAAGGGTRQAIRSTSASARRCRRRMRLLAAHRLQGCATVRHAIRRNSAQFGAIL